MVTLFDFYSTLFRSREILKLKKKKNTVKYCRYSFIVQELLPNWCDILVICIQDVPEVERRKYFFGNQVWIIRTYHTWTWPIVDVTEKNNWQGYGIAVHCKKWIFGYWYARENKIIPNNNLHRHQMSRNTSKPFYLLLVRFSWH